jgi:hypothetical protein
MNLRRAQWAMILLCFVASAAKAGELDGYTGRLKYNDDDPNTYTWGIEYREPLSDHWAASFVWLNEGHKPHDHRDGQALQIRWHTGPELSDWTRLRSAVFSRRPWAASHPPATDTHAVRRRSGT